MYPAIEYFVYKLWRTYPVRWLAACDSRVHDFWICRILCLFAIKSNTNEAYGNTYDRRGAHTITWIPRTVVRCYSKA